MSTVNFKLVADKVEVQYQGCGSHALELDLTVDLDDQYRLNPDDLHILEGTLEKLLENVKEEHRERRESYAGCDLCRRDMQS